MFLYPSETSQSANIEVASYVIMALLKQNTSENAGTVHGIIRWLQTKLKPSGGFYSTVVSKFQAHEERM